jgi:tetratricopeptide (TPR) repeat protein
MVVVYHVASTVFASLLAALALRGVGEVAMRSLSALAYYVTKAVFPPPQSAVVMDLPGAWLTLVALAVLSGGAAWAIRRWRRGQPVWVLALWWFTIALLPALPVAATRLAAAPVAERYLYVPSLAVSLLLGAFLAQGLARPSRRLLTAGLTLGILVLAAVGTHLRGRLWLDDIALWTDTVEKAPSSGLAWAHLGKAYLDRGSDLTRALHHYERALEADDDSMGKAISYNSIGVIQAKLGRQEEAVAAWNASIAQRGDYAMAHYNLGNFLASRVEKARAEGRVDASRPAEARSHLSRALEHDPRYRKAWLRLVWCHVQEALYLSGTLQGSAEARAALAEAEVARLRLKAVDPDGSFTRQADKLIERTRRTVEAQEASAVPHDAPLGPAR